MNKKTIPIYLAFLCMGFGDVVGPLTSLLQEEYELTNFLSSMVTFMGFIMFGILSIPLGIYQDRTNRKHVLTIGLFLALAGLVMPIIGNYSSFALILGALLLLGTGATTLQVSGNPIMRDVSLEGKYSRNLSFGQFVKAIGSLSGAVIPLIAKNYFGLDWRLLFPIYSSFIVITLIVLFLTPIREKKVENAMPASFKSSLKLLKNPSILLMVIGIFLYVGSEVSMSARLPNYLNVEFGYDLEEYGLWGTLLFFLSLMTGRFLGGVILNWLPPKQFLVITSIISILGVFGLFLAPNAVVGIVIILIIGLGFANIFPLIFSITVDAYPELTNEISGLMVTAIIGGAIIPILFGVVADAANIVAGFLVPLACMIYIFIVALKSYKI